jgi:hypothetical protein
MYAANGGESCMFSAILGKWEFKECAAETVCIEQLDPHKLHNLETVGAGRPMLMTYPCVCSNVGLTW